jgi:hypothetical protein
MKRWQNLSIILRKKTDFLKETDMLVQGYAFGELWLGWKKYITTEEESKTMIELLENIKINLQNKSPEISTEEIQAIPIDDSHFKRCIASPFPVSELMKITEALTQMVSGTWDIIQNNKNLL